MIFDLVTVTYDREFPLMKLQARSLVRFMDPDAIGRIIVVINGGDVARDRRQFEDEVLDEYGPLRDRVVLMSRKDLMDETGCDSRSGWQTQQVCKLSVYRAVTAPYYMVLDSKNIFIKPVGRDNFFSDGRPTMTFHEYSPAKFENYRNARRLFGMPDVEPPQRTGRITTPYMMITPMVAWMYEEVEKRFEDRFEVGFLRENATLTEFLMYYAFLQRVSAPDLLPYAKGSFDTTIFWHGTEEGFEKRLTSVEKPSKNAISLHRKFLSLAPTEQLVTLGRFLTEKGLLRDAQEGVDLLTKVGHPD